MNAEDIGQAILGRLEERQREIVRLRAELETARAGKKRADEAYGDLAALLGERLEVSQELDRPRCLRRVLARLDVAEALFRLPKAERVDTLTSIGETLCDALLLSLAACDGHDLERVPLRRRLSSLKPPDLYVRE